MGPVGIMGPAGPTAAGSVGFTGPTGPTGPGAPGTDIDWIPLGEVVKDGEIVVRKVPDSAFEGGRLTLKFRCSVFTAGIANYGSDGWKFFTGGNESPSLLLARAVLLEASKDMKLLADAEAEALPLWRAIVRRVERLWAVADVMMT